MLNSKDLIKFELKIKKIYEEGKIKAPIHLSGGNEKQLIKIFKKIKRNDWVISNWRSHYHALLHGVPKKWLLKKILLGKSMGINSKKYKFYASSIAGGGLPIAAGIALGNKLKKKQEKVWVFVGDMTYETGQFHEVYKYSKNFNLPIKFIVEDNNLHDLSGSAIALYQGNDGSGRIRRNIITKANGTGIRLESKNIFDKTH